MQKSLLGFLGKNVTNGDGKVATTGILAWEQQEMIEAVKQKARKNDENNQSCVNEACVMCKSATPDSKPVHMLKNHQIVEIGGLSELNVKDIALEKPFARCKKKGMCNVNQEAIENQEWYDTNIEKGNTAYILLMQGRI